MKDPAEDVRGALASIIEGRIVKRIRHDLIHDGRDLTRDFERELTLHGYLPSTVEAVDVRPGERVPAFLIRGATAFFGWVFWEQFTSWKLRKLWGSEIRNRKGDWDIQIPAGRPETVYANPALRIEMDIDHPGEF